MARSRLWAWTVPLLVLGAALVRPAAADPAPNPQLLSGLGSTPSAGLVQSGLLDMSRLDIRHRLSFGYSSSSVGGSQSAGLWTTRVGYRFSDPLHVSLDVGAVLDPGGESLLNERSFFLGGFQLDYRPSDAFRLNISYVNVPGRARPAFGYRGFAPGSLWAEPADEDR